MIAVASFFFCNSILVGAQPVIASETEKIEISALSEGYTLNGVLIKKTHTQEKLPAIIFLVGSGGTSSHSTNYANFTRFFFEEILLDHGFAVVYFDKRGVESSEGVWYNTTFEQRALDAKNMALEVGNFDFIDAENIYLIGHSQGGWIAQIAVATWPQHFAGAISMAGPTYGVRKQIIDEYHSRFICDDNMNDEAALRKATRNVNRDLFFISFLGWSGNWKQLRIIRDFEADEYIRSISKPFLFLFAENDELVNPEWAMEDLGMIFPNGSPPFIETYIADGQNHSFRVAPLCYRGEWDVLKYSESTRKKITEWLISQFE
jgi:pimeloyl-ACP methyl ester carboxylesterase